MRQWMVLLAVPCLLLGLAGGPARADEPTADQKLVKKVMDRLLAVIHETPPEYVWPPQYKILNDKETAQTPFGEYNAMAGPLALDEKTDTLQGFVKDEKTGQIKTMVIITPKFMKEIVDGDADGLGCVLGHELSHLLLKHSLRDKTADTPFAGLNFSRDDEQAADLLGEELALKAGFSYKGFVTIYTKLEKFGVKYTSFEGLQKGHPAPKDRIAMMDKEHAKLWHAMSAYESGVDFLALEQYASAERCFQTVTDQFPDAYDAWANLGYARLMQYCDALDQADVKRFDVGHLLTGGFYVRPKSLEVKTRGIDEKQWKSAVDALQTAIKLQPDLVLAQADLGIAYLVAPDGKDVKKADKWLQPAAEAAAKDDKMELMDRVTVLTNAGVADMAAGRADAASVKLNQADKLAGAALAAPTDKRAKSSALVSALAFNLALVEGASADKDKRNKALGYWGVYFATATPASNWWAVGYDHYAELCKALGVAAKSSDELFATPGRVGVLRQETSVKLANGESVVLSEPVADVQKRLGTGVVIPVPGSKLVRVCYPDLGVEVFGSDRVEAIYLVGAKAPTLPLKTTELGSKFFEVKVGMDKGDIDDFLSGITSDSRRLLEPDRDYRYFPDMGFAVRFDKGKVSEVVLAIMPREPVAQK